MNENTLILTEHRLAPRLFDAALTLIAWGGFLFFLYARLWMQLTEEGDHRWSVIIASFNTVLVYLLIAAFNGWLLILWYQYNRRRAHVRRRHPEMLRHDELAQSFNVTPQITCGGVFITGRRYLSFTTISGSISLSFFTTSESSPRRQVPP
ncbi:MAG: poly-beta-1,6-N-acetyl-D-glucosamine biosynthesis protein PgaD [Enterobacter hormaechei]|nr:poly-beta-1,6-N-acetyl-D-glucosamine biosynthesis protein PgaD [Enterobacter hormaechei]